MINYVTATGSLSPDQLHGFFEGWPNPPSPETHLRILQKSDHVVLAIDQNSGQVVGFITAITDKVLTAFIPLLEVLPDYKGRGIGQELVKRMRQELSGFYQVTLACDPDLQPFYERTGMMRSTGMLAIDYTKQSGK